MERVCFEIESIVKASPEDVWRAVTSVEGVQYELRPLVRMTFPDRITVLDEAAVIFADGFESGDARKGMLTP